MNSFINHHHLLPQALSRQTPQFRAPKDFGKVTVLFGGRSSEREVSLESGKNVLAALKNKGVNAHHLDPIDPEFVLKLSQGQFDAAFIVLHGKEGEDGVIQGLLQSLNIPFTGSGVAASALAMDKVRSKFVFQAFGLPTPRYGVAFNLQQAMSLAQTLNCPLAVKPTLEGSSIGITCVKNVSEMKEAYHKAAQYGDVMVEEWIEGKELTVAILGQTAFSPVEVVASNCFYDYEAKYHSDETQYLCPAPLSKAKTNELLDMAVKSFFALGCEGWGRADFIQDRQGNFWLLEMNTVPGMTSHSLVPKSAYAMGFTFEELVMTILEMGLLSRGKKEPIKRVATSLCEAS